MEQMPNWVSAAISVGMFIVTLVGMAVGGTWTMGQFRSTVQEMLARNREEVDEAMLMAERRVGETMSAVRQKIADVELESLKTFVRRDSFYEMLTRMTNEFKANQEATHARLDRFEAKLDRLIDSRSGT